MPITNHHTKIEALSATIRIEDRGAEEYNLIIKDGKVYDDGEEVGKVLAVDYARTHK